MHIKNSYKYKAVYILDNGAYMAKIGSNHKNEPALIPNCIMKVKSERRRPFIGDQIEECRDVSGLFYILPFQKGYLVNWDIQKTVWDYMFSKELTNGKFTEVPLCITEPIMNFQSVQEAMDEIFFEEYDSCGLLRLTPTDLSAYNYSVSNSKVENCVVIDSGYSFTHVVPYIQGKKYLPGVKRLDVGGKVRFLNTLAVAYTAAKVLTNHLKEIISYRQLHVMDETYVINQMKEDCCFVSTNFLRDMRTTTHRDIKNTIVRDYILPDYNKIRRGYMEIPPHLKNAETTAESESNSNSGQSQPGDTQSIKMNNERITIPEILFHPSDIGIQQKGIAETVVECIKDCPPDAQYQLLENIILTGGNTCFKNFHSRLYDDIRKSFDENYNFNLFSPNNSTTYAWEGGKKLASTDEFFNFMVTKEEYEEYGSSFSSTHLREFNFLV